MASHFDSCYLDIYIAGGNVTELYVESWTIKGRIILTFTFGVVLWFGALGNILVYRVLAWPFLQMVLLILTE